MTEGKRCDVRGQRRACSSIVQDGARRVTFIPKAATAPQQATIGAEHAVRVDEVYPSGHAMDRPAIRK
jgi:hypothetical protein